MSVWEVTKKYLPMLNAGRIKREQYDWLIEQALKPHVEHFVETYGEAIKKLSEDTTHDDEEVGRSQKARLLALLSDGEWHDTVEMLNKVYKVDDHAGIARPGARVFDLKKDGINIESRRKQGTVWEYRIVRS